MVLGSRRWVLVKDYLNPGNLVPRTKHLQFKDAKRLIRIRLQIAKEIRLNLSQFKPSCAVLDSRLWVLVKGASILEN